MKRFLVAAAAIALVASCSNPVESKDDEKKVQSVDDQTEVVFAQIDSARDEFYAGIEETTVSASITPSMVESDENKTFWNSLNAKNKIVMLAMEAQVTKDDSEIISYLKEIGQYENFLRLKDKLSAPELQEKIASLPDSKSLNVADFNSWTMGEVGLSIDESSNGSSGSGNSGCIGALIPGTWKHAGMWDGRYGKFHTASIDTGYSDGRVGFETPAYWSTKHKVSGWIPKKHTASKATAACDYALNQHGEGFSFATSRDNTSKWYCSKLVWRSWEKQGVDLENYKPLDDVPDWLEQDAWVTPNDLAADGRTVFAHGDYLKPNR